MYSQPIDRGHKAMFLFLLDQSFSMTEPMGGGQGQSKMDELASAINGWLQNMVLQATGGEGIKDYFDIAVIGYRTDADANPIIESALAGPLAGRQLCSIVDIANGVAEMARRRQTIYDDETGETNEVEVDVPIWVQPKAEGATPTFTLLCHAHELLKNWIDQHPNSFPPVVVHITDGECSEQGEAVAYADPIKQLATEDGNVLFFNCHLSMTKADPFLFPHSGEILPDQFARTLFDMSSVLPDPLYQRALKTGFTLQPGARGMAFNADMISLIKFLDIGTRVSNLR
jgi:hypothetical protein